MEFFKVKKFQVNDRFDNILTNCKIGHYVDSAPYGTKSEDIKKYMSITYCSIDRHYQGKGYLKLMIIELMKLCLDKNFILGSSSWTVPGNIKLRPGLKKYAKKYGVEFIDHDEKHDTPTEYNRKLIHNKDMREDEKETWKKGDIFGK